MIQKQVEPCGDYEFATYQHAGGEFETHFRTSGGALIDRYPGKLSRADRERIHRQHVAALRVTFDNPPSVFQSVVGT